MESPSRSTSVSAQAMSRGFPSRGVAIFHDMGVDRRLLDHGDIVEQAHVAHAAAGVARIQIGAQQRELFARRFRRHFAARQIGVAPHDALLAADGGELGRHDAHRDAGRTAFAGRAIGDGSGCGGNRNG